MTTCAICCDEITDNGIKTPCNHSMHNSCLTHWLLLQNSCPICRHDLSGCQKTQNDETDSIFEEDLDDMNEEDDIDDILVNFNNELYTSNYSTVLDALREILYRISMTQEEEDEMQFIPSYRWYFDEKNNAYYVKLYTRNQIIDIVIDAEYYDNDLYLDISFKSIDKRISKYLKNKMNKDIYISNYTQKNLPTRILCY